MDKQIVHYKPNDMQVIVKGLPALVIPIDHPSPLISNKGYVRTTIVSSFNPETGEFETKNSKYIPVKEKKKTCSSCCC